MPIIKGKSGNSGIISIYRRMCEDANRGVFFPENEIGVIFETLREMEEYLECITGVGNSENPIVYLLRNAIHRSYEPIQARMYT